MRPNIEFLKQPIRLRSHLRPVVVPDSDAVVLVCEQASHFLEGAIYGRLIPLLDGSINATEISCRLADEFSKFQVIDAVVGLHQQGHLALGSTIDLVASQDRFWESVTETVRQPVQASVAIHTSDDEAREALASSLRKINVEVNGQDAALTVLLADSYLDPQVEEYCRHATGPMLLVKPCGREGWIGPLIIPEESACWECLAQRLRHNREAQQLLAKEEGTSPSPASLPTSMLAVINAAATQIGRWFFTDDEHPLRNGLLAINTVTGESRWHTIVHRPQCPSCSTLVSPEPYQQQPLMLQSRSRISAGAIGHRLIRPEKMIETYEHHVSPITGIVPALVEITDDGITHVCLAGQSSPQPAKNWQALLASRRNNSSGKGVNAIEAKASALGEALERYSSHWDGTATVMTASLAELGDDAVPPNASMLFSEAQLRNYDSTNKNFKKSFKRHVAKPLDLDQPIDWIQAWSLTQNSWRYIAAGSAYFRYDRPHEHRYCIGDSNGNAAGTCLEDAILQGCLELVERDSVALWWYNQVRRPGVSLEGIHDSYVHALQSHYASIQRELWLLDLTSDLEIPAFVAASRRVDDGPDECVMGYGAHLDPRVAALRALTEMNQLLPVNLRHAERADRQLPEPGDPLTSLDIELAEHPYMLPDDSQAVKQIDDLHSDQFDNLQDEVEFCRQQIETQGMEMIVVDLTRPDIGLPVVKVIVPGMRHFWRRLAPGRLYDVPVQMGWISNRTKEENVNPIDLHG